MANCLQPCGLQPTRLFCTWDFSRKEYWSGLPFPSPRDLPGQGSNPHLLSPAVAGRFFTTSSSWEAHSRSLSGIISLHIQNKNFTRVYMYFSPSFYIIAMIQSTYLYVKFCLVTQTYPTVCNLMDCNTPGFPVHHQLRSGLKLTSIESVMPSSHLILCLSLLLLSSIFPSIRVFSNESVLCIRWPKYWSFSFSICPSNEYPGLISFTCGVIFRADFI